MNKYEQIKGMANPNRGSVGVQEARPPQRKPLTDNAITRLGQEIEQVPSSVQQAYGMAQVCLDLHDALGCKWGDNVYLAIDQLKAAAHTPQRKPLTDEQDELSAEIKAQPEQEPWDNEAFSNWWDSDYEDSTNPYEKDSLAYWAWAGWQAALAQPEQEPVQYKCTVTDDQHPNGIPLEQWAKPPQRTWVALTDAEIHKLRLFEAKLKESK